MHCVCVHRLPQDGHSPRVWNVFHVCPQPGLHAHMSVRAGRHLQDGQRMPDPLSSRCSPRSGDKRSFPFSRSATNGTDHRSSGIIIRAPQDLVSVVARAGGRLRAGAAFLVGSGSFRRAPSSVVEHLTFNQGVPGSIPGGPISVGGRRSVGSRQSAISSYLSCRTARLTSKRMQTRPRHLLVPFLFVVAIACGPTAPAGSRMITSIRYERTYPATSGSDERLHISVSIPSSRRIPVCFPEAESGDVFVCRILNWTTDTGEECSVQVNDPAVGRAVATTVYINGSRVSRIERLPNGTEFGRFRLTATGVQ